MNAGIFSPLEFLCILLLQMMVQVQALRPLRQRAPGPRTWPVRLEQQEEGQVGSEQWPRERLGRGGGGGQNIPGLGHHPKDVTSIEKETRSIGQCWYWTDNLFGLIYAYTLRTPLKANSQE